MGLDACVYCNCTETGQLTVPHPYPELLYIDEGGCPCIRHSGPDMPSEEWDKVLAHDQWLDGPVAPCCHESCILTGHYIGNIALVQCLREIVRVLSADPESDFPVIWSKVIYNGIHCGDRLDLEQVSQLEEEVKRLRSYDLAPVGGQDAEYLSSFLSQMEELIVASQSVRKPICF